MNKNDYINFSITDFVCDDAFLEHQLSPTVDSTRFWSEWLNAHPHKSADIEQAKQLLDAVRMGLNDYARTYLSPEAEAQLLERIRHTNTQYVSETRIVPLWRTTWVRVAVAACFVLVSTIWYFKSNTTGTPSVYQQQIQALTQTSFEKTNDTEQNINIPLPDGSQVILYPKSRLTYTADFGKDVRIIYLSGQASFDVVKDSQRPFYVYANELVTKVLGTRFVVQAFEKEKNVTVTVQSGKVSVYHPQTNKTQDTNNRSILLLPNQQVVFERVSEQFKKSLVMQPVLLEVAKTEKISFDFEETAVSEVFLRLKKAYGVDITFNTDLLKKCEITASLNEETLFEKLDIITQIIHGTYENIDGQIVIKAEGCQ